MAEGAQMAYGYTLEFYTYLTGFKGKTNRKRVTKNQMKIRGKPKEEVREKFKEEGRKEINQDL